MARDCYRPAKMDKDFGIAESGDVCGQYGADEARASFTCTIICWAGGRWWPQLENGVRVMRLEDWLSKPSLPTPVLQLLLAIEHTLRQ